MTFDMTLRYFCVSRFSTSLPRLTALTPSELTTIWNLSAWKVWTTFQSLPRTRQTPRDRGPRTHSRPSNRRSDRDFMPSTRPVIREACWCWLRMTWLVFTPTSCWIPPSTAWSQGEPSGASSGCDPSTRDENRRIPQSKMAVHCTVFRVILAVQSALTRLFICRTLGYERVYLPLYKVADTPFHIQGRGTIY